MTMRAGVIGHPVAHSLSPLIHSCWIAKYGLDAAYEAVEIAPDRLAEGLQSLIRQGFSGFNVTLPHKEKILDFCAAVDPVARAIGAVNTVTIRQGRLHGANTDAFGFIENLKDRQPGYMFPSGAALVLGAGGAARAVVYALLDAGTPAILLANRSPERAHDIASAAFAAGRVKTIPWNECSTAASGATLIVNTTPLGMTRQDKLDLDLSPARPGTIVYDIVYRPLMTGLLSAAAARGLPVVTGLGMLLHQARPAFAAWFGVSPEIDEELRARMEKASR